MQGTIHLLLFLIWVAVWTLGGWWLVRSAFNLKPYEEGLVGLVVGLVSETVLTNFLARLMPLQTAGWVAAGILLLGGLLLMIVTKKSFAVNLRAVIGQWLVFLAITYVFYLIARGLAIYDDYAHLPTLSIMATGKIPPNFAYDPNATYGYHYLLLLFGAQIMNLTGWMPWTAWDFARAFTIAPAVILGGLWAYRVTRSKVAASLGAAGVLFISGTRWLMLLIPESLLAKLMAPVALMGAGADAGANLIKSLAHPWPIEGQGSFQFPFAFENGLFTPGAEAANNAIGLLVVAIILVFLLTGTRWRNRWGGVVSILLIAGLGLLDETQLPLLALAFLAVTLFRVIKNRSFHLPTGLKDWWWVWLVAGLFVAVEGGVWSDTLSRLLAQARGAVLPASYHTIAFELSAPAIISNQLGVLPLFNLRTLVLALLEIGPTLLILPLLLPWARKAARAGRWYEAMLGFAAILSLALLLVRFAGETGIRNSSRIYFFIPVCNLMAISLGWLWVSHRKPMVKQIAATLLGVSFFGGIVMLGVQLPNIMNRTYSYFISPLDVSMTSKYWNRLEPDALVFDPTPSRAVTVFGRYTDAGTNWYTFKPEFVKLVADPFVEAIRQAGYSYVYLDNDYWKDQMDYLEKESFEQSCVILLDEKVDADDARVWRRLYDIRNCQ